MLMAIWRKYFLCLIVVSNQIFQLSAQDARTSEDIKNEEPFTLGSLDPEPFQDAIYEFRRLLQDRIYDYIIDAYEDTGINEHINTATESVGSVAESISEALQGLRSTFTNDQAGAQSFYAYIDDFIDAKAEAVYEDFEGICEGSSENRRRVLVDRRLSKNTQDQEVFLQGLGASMSSSSGDQAVFNATEDQCPASEPTSDKGAIALTLGVEKYYRFQNKKTGIYFDAGVGVGADFGFLLNTGDFKTLVGAGLAVNVGREIPPPSSSPSKQSSTSSTPSDSPTNLSLNKPVPSNSPSSIPTSSPSSRPTRTPSSMPTSTLSSSSQTRTLFQNDFQNRTYVGNRSLRKSSRGWTDTSITLGFTVYLPGNSGDMNGFASWDISVAVGNIPFLQGITFHVGHPWYACKQCSCTNNQDRFRNPEEFFGCGWYLSGFTIDIFDFLDISDLKQKIENFKNNGGFKGAFESFIDAFRSTENFKGAMAQFEGSLTFSPVLSVGVISTEDKWDVTENFQSLPWWTLIDNKCSNYDVDSKCSCPSSYPSTAPSFTPSDDQSVVPSSHPSLMRRFLRAEEAFSERKFSEKDGSRFLRHDLTTENKTNKQQVPAGLLSDKSPHRRLGLSDSISNIMSVIAELFSHDGIGVPYCFGDCPNGEDFKKFEGEIILAPSKDCSELTLAASSEKMTLSNVAHVLLREINVNLANTVANVIGPYANFGIDNANIALTITPYPEITMKVSGSPLLPVIDRSVASDIEIFFNDIFDGLTLSITSNVRSFESASVRLEASLPPTNITDYLSLEGSDGFGTGVYFKYEVVNFKPSNVPTQITTFGLELPMKICVRDCSTVQPEIIYLQGNIFSEVVVGDNPIPASRIGGLLTLVGTWAEAFGLPILHISNVVAGATFDLKTPFPAPPSSLTLGASACLGSTQACNIRNIDAKDFIASASYVGLDTAVPEKNFFFAMISSFTIENILNIAAELESSLHDLVLGLPRSVLDSGITSPNGNATACASTGNITAQATGAEVLNLDCYAYVVISPLSTNRIDSINLDIQRGISFAGKLNLFNVYQIQTEAKIDVIDTTNPGFFLETQLSNIKLGDFLEIGKEYNSVTKSVEGDAYFIIDYKTIPFKLLVNIEAAIGIPALKSYGEVDISVTDDGASLKGEINIFDGVLKPRVLVEWDWKFTYFYAELGDITFAPGILELKRLILDIETKNGFDLFFDIQITVLSFADIGASLLIEERNNGQDLWVKFEVVIETPLVDTKVVGDATLDLVTITDTEFGEFDVTLMPGGAAKAIAEFVEAGVEAVKEFFDDVIGAVNEVINEIGDSFNEVLNELDFLTDAWNDFGNAANLLTSGDPIGAAIALKEGFETFFDPSSWEDVGDAILEGLEDVGLAINDAILGGLGLSSTSSTVTLVQAPGKDQWNCSFLRKKTVTKRCWSYIFGRTCKTYTDYSQSFHDSKCVQEKKDRLEEARAKVETAGNYGLGAKETQDGNAAILNVNRDTYPIPEIYDITGTVTYSPNGTVGSQIKSTITGQFKKLDNDQSDSYSSTNTSFTSAEVTINLSPNDRRRLQTGGGSISQGFSDSVSAAFQTVEELIDETVNEDMKGLDHRIKQFGGDTLEPLEIKFASTDKTIAVACGALASASTIKPMITKFDPDCGSPTFLQSSQAMTFHRIDTDYRVSNIYPCGTVKITREYICRDKCNQMSMDSQTIFLEPEAPLFTFVPEQEAEKTYSTSVESLNPSAQNDNWPVASSECGHAVVLDSSDALPEQVGGQCGTWNLKRIWEATLVFNEVVDTYCSNNDLPPPPSATTFQQYHIQDDEPPVIVENIPTEIRIPFFNNYNSTRLNAPLIEDIPTNEQAKEWGLAVGEETLTSEDFGLYVHTGNEAECRKNGIAHFQRKWTAKDMCGNERNFTQKIIIDHPPELLTATSPIVDGVFSYSPGVKQSQDTCLPGKIITLGYKSYAADFDFSVKTDICPDGLTWDENGCRLQTSTDEIRFELLSIKPKFEFFPDDVTVNTKESIDSSVTGVPVGTAYCSTPFEIDHKDDEAVLVECGVWQIKRRWTIRPIYDGCVMVTDPRLVTESVQVITILDIFAPEFIFLPDAQVDVPFLGDYGPGNIDVDYPRVEDQAYHETLIEHATVHNAVDKLFISYNTTLSYTDHIDFKKSSTEACNDVSLADVTRTWTTSDRCGNAASFIQTIHITEPSDFLFGDASGYQLALPSGYLKLANSHVSHIVMSKAEGFNMLNSSIYCSSNCSKATDISLILDSCPKYKLNKSFFPDGTVLFKERKISKSSKSYKSSKSCDVFKEGSGSNSYSGGEKDAVALSEEKFPVSFNLAKKEINQISNVVTESPNSLLTGPQTINCTTPYQSSCFNVKMSSLERISTKTEYNTGNIYLTGPHRVYNFYDVQMDDWFYSLIKYKTPPVIKVEAEGFVFVNVIDTVNITALPYNENRASVTRDWDKAADFVCKLKKTSETSKGKTVPVIGNYAKTPKSSKSQKSSESSKVLKADLKYGLKTITTGDLAQDPSTHLLVNLQTLAHINLDAKYHSIREEDALLCSGLQYQFTPYPFKSSTTKGTYVLPNSISSFELQDHSWEGGQFMTLGPEIKFESVDMKHGLYLPDEFRFCNLGVQPSLV